MVLALRAEVHQETVGGAAGTLTVAVIGTLLAVFVADVVAHITVHQALPTRAELAHMVVVVLGAAETLVLPLLVIGLAALGLFTLDVALTTSIVILVVTLVAVGYLAVRRLRAAARAAPPGAARGVRARAARRRRWSCSAH